MTNINKDFWKDVEVILKKKRKLLRRNKRYDQKIVKIVSKNVKHARNKKKRNARKMKVKNKQRISKIKTLIDIRNKKCKYGGSPSTFDETDEKDSEDGIPS